MTLQQLRQVLKALGDDTRLRLLNLLSIQDLTVKDMCDRLKISQSTVSKHLMRLRLLRMVIDKREGNLVRYRLNRNSDQGRIIHSTLAQAKKLRIFQEDAKKHKY